LLFLLLWIYYNLKLGVVITQALLVLLRMALTLQGLLCSHMNFKIAFSIFVKNVIEILMGIILNL
jgi:hypothetical protein